MSSEEQNQNKTDQNCPGIPLCCPNWYFSYCDLKLLKDIFKLVPLRLQDNTNLNTISETVLRSMTIHNYGSFGHQG